MQMKSFSSMSNYYHLLNLTHILEPHHKLLCKSSKWNWRREQKQNFEKVNEITCSSKLLIHYDPETPLVLAYDGSAYGLDAVLSYTIPFCSEKPIAYSSRTLIL